MKVFPIHEQVILDLYARAARLGEWSVPMPRKSDAMSFRARVYAFVKALRKRAEVDFDARDRLALVESVSLQVLETSEGGRWMLRFERKDRSPAMLAAIASLGGIDAIEDPMETAAMESLAKVQASLEQDAVQAKAEPLLPQAAGHDQRASAYGARAQAEGAGSALPHPAQLENPKGEDS